mmetsp:Transcript_8161/g.14789  ORF Transcript_8161/g.14789 Transcript_8161/m.14789 type:complete len:255 (-) Transcript_8161:364-1128(-)
MRNRSRLRTRLMGLEEMPLSWQPWRVKRRRRRRLSTRPRPCMPFRNWRRLAACSDLRPRPSFRKRRRSTSSVASSMSCRNTSFYNSSFRIRWRSNDLSTVLLRSREIVNVSRWLARLPLRALSMERLSMLSLSSLATPMCHWLPATLNAFFALESFRWIPSRARTRAIRLMKNILSRSWNLPHPTSWPRYPHPTFGRDGRMWEIPTKSSRSLPCSSRSRMMPSRQSLTSLVCSHATGLDISNLERGARNPTCFI